ncbi:hypothetical protein JCM11641_000210, partial [Rhodosporidiobolus odoratus]
TTDRPFIFGKVHITENGIEACTDQSFLESQGIVELCYCRVKGFRLMTEQWPDCEVQPIAETSKKALLSHQIAYGEEVAVDEADMLVADLLDSPEETLRSVEFRYRSRLSPSLTPLSSASPSPKPASRTASASPELGVNRPLLPDLATITTPAHLPHLRAGISGAVAQSRASLPRSCAPRSIPSSGMVRTELQREAERREGGPGLLHQDGQGRGRAEDADTCRQEDARDAKKVKKEEMQKIEKDKKDRRKKGIKPEVIDLCDSD